MNENNKELNTLHEYFDNDPTDELPVLTDRAGAVEAGIEDTGRSPILQLADPPLTESVASISQDPRSLSIHRLEREVERLQDNWLELEDELRARDDHNERLADELADREATVARLEDELAGAEQARRELEARGADLETQLASRGSAANEADSQLALAHGELDNRQRQLDAVREQLESLRADAEQMLAEAADRDADQIRLRAERTALTQQLADLHSYIEGRKPRWEAQETELGVLRLTIAAKDRELERIGAERQEAQARLIEEQARAQALDEQLGRALDSVGALRHTIADLEARCEQTSAALADAEQENRALATQAEAGLADQQHAREHLSAELESTRDEITSLSAQLKTEQALLETAGVELRAAREESQRLNEQRDELVEALEQSRAIQESQDDRLATVTADLESLQADRATQEDRAAHLANETEALRKELDHLREATARAAELEQQRTELRARLDDSERRNETLQVEIGELHDVAEELARLRTEYDALQSHLADRDSEHEHLRQQITEIDAQRSELGQLLAERDQQVHNLENELKDNLKVMREIGRSQRSEPVESTNVPRLTQRAAGLKRKSSGRLLIAITDDHAGHFPLDKPVMIIGRGAEADIQIRKKYISRRHARIVSDDAGVRIEDLDSKNGVLVDSRRVLSQELRDGNVINIGEFKLSFVDPADRSPRAGNSHGG